MSFLKKNDYLIISDCSHAEIFKVEKIYQKQNEQTITPNAPLKGSFLKNAEISRLQKNNFYVANTKRKNQDGSPIYSLYLKDINNKTFELVEHIQDLQFNYIRSENDNIISTEIKVTVFVPPYQKSWFGYAVNQ